MLQQNWTCLVYSSLFSYITKIQRTNYNSTVYPKKYAHGFCFAVRCCGYTLTDFPISIRLISMALWQSDDYPSASKATLMNMDKYFMWIHYERLHNHNKAKHSKTVCIFLGIYCISVNCTRVLPCDVDVAMRYGWCRKQTLPCENDSAHGCSVTNGASKL